MEFSQNVVDVRGCNVTLKRAGSGPTMLYLHGASGAAVVQPFMRELAAHFDLLVPEHPGFGGSDEPAWLDNIHDLAYFYLDLLDQLRLQQVFLVGSSIGGWLALEIAVRDTARLARLSVVAPAGIFVPGLPRGDIFLPSAEERIRNLFFDQGMADRLLVRTASPDDADATLKNEFTTARLAWEPRMFDPHLSKWLHRVSIPTQIIWGQEDRILSPGYAAEFAKLIPDARVDLLPQCGHLPHIEKPEEFVRLVRTFANSRSRAA
jgi:pimeloyl-ACP methyl ester carboxylesterase